MWMCTSCYNCIVRCPRELPITHIMHGLAHYAKRLGLVPENQPTAKFAQKFWDNLMKKGRVNELKLGMALYFMNGFGEGVKTALGKQKLGMDMMKTKRMNPMEILGGHAVKDLSGFQKAIAKARELEDARMRDTAVEEKTPMATREYSFYPGCSSQKGASSSNYMTSVQTMCEELDIQLNEIPDWNCCAASIGYAGGGELPRLTLSARNIALSEEHNPGQEIVATCAACWLSTREAAERLGKSESLMAEANEALAEAGLKLKNETPIKHMAEVLIEDIGYDAIGEKVKKPLEGIKIAGYVGCQTNRPFGIAGESYENPKYLDKLVDTLGGELHPGLREEGAMLRRRAGLLRAGEVPGDGQGHHRGRLRPRRGHDRHPLPGVPDERGGLPGRHQRHLRHQVQHAGGLLLDPDVRGLRALGQGRGAGCTDHPGQEAG